MTEALISLQKAIYETLNNDSDLSNLITGVYDFPPAGSDFPYVQVNVLKSADWSTVSSRGREVKLVVLTYSNHRGSLEALRISDDIEALLHNANLELEGGHILVDIRYTGGEMSRSKDGLVYIAKNMFTVFVEE